MTDGGVHSEHLHAGRLLESLLVPAQRSRDGLVGDNATEHHFGALDLSLLHLHGDGRVQVDQCISLPDVGDATFVRQGDRSAILKTKLGSRGQIGETLLENCVIGDSINDVFIEDYLKETIKN